MHYTTVENIRSAWREYQAIHELGVNVPLLPEILATNRSSAFPRTPDYNDNSKIEQMIEEEKKSLLESNQQLVQQNEDILIQQEHIPKDFIQYLKNKFNSSQYYSIQLAATKQGFTLVQGPPGTGKTSTIIGMLNTVHLREYNRYYQELIEVFTNQQKLLKYQQQMASIHGSSITKEQFIVHVMQQYSKSKPRILIVAPSNIAVDNIITRIMKDGFLDGNRNIYHPEIVRVGGGRTIFVEKVALEYLVQQECHTTLSFTEKQELLEDYNQKISNIIKEMITLQTMLITLTQSFNVCNPLPAGWELRVSLEHGHPYWVDHTTRSTSNDPPIHLVELLTKSSSTASPSSPSYKSAPLSVGYTRVEDLPEYALASHRFIELLSNMEKISMKKNRLASIINIQSLTNKEKIPMSVKENLETSIIEGAQLLFTTLNSCGHPSMEAAEFCVTVIDEAAQSTEPSTLIALRKGCRQCILVGDQRQLPATIFSELVMKYNYNRSLFERLIESGHSYVMLDQQYRMTPEISEFPSKFFYYSKLSNGENVKDIHYLPLFIRPNRLMLKERKEEIEDNFLSSAIASGSKGPREDQEGKGFDMIPIRRENDYALFYPVMFFDLQSSRDVTTALTSSKINRDEIKLCIQLIKILFAEGERVFQIQNDAQYQKFMQVILSPETHHAEKRKQEHLLQEKVSELIGSIGIITPYSEQLAELEREFFQQGLIRRKGASDRGGDDNGPRRRFTKYQKLSIELNTIDGFQGKEKDIIILSTVRANEEKKIGFLSDIRRLNVAITRAKYGMFIVGNADTLYTNRYWRYLLNHLTTQNALLKVPNNEVPIKRLLEQHQKKFSHYPSKSPLFVDNNEAIESVMNGGDSPPPPPPPPSPPRSDYGVKEIGEFTDNGYQRDRNQEVFGVDDFCQQVELPVDQWNYAHQSQSVPYEAPIPYLPSDFNHVGYNTFSTNNMQYLQQPSNGMYHGSSYGPVPSHNTSHPSLDPGLYPGDKYDNGGQSAFNRKRNGNFTENDYQMSSNQQNKQGYYRIDGTRATGGNGNQDGPRRKQFRRGNEPHPHNSATNPLPNEEKRVINHVTAHVPPPPPVSPKATEIEDGEVYEL